MSSAQLRTPLIMRRQASLLLFALVAVTALAGAAHGARSHSTEDASSSVVRKGFVATLDSLGHKLGRWLRWG